MTTKCQCEQCLFYEREASEAGFSDFKDPFGRGELTAAYALSLAEELALVMFHRGAAMQEVLRASHLPEEHAQFCSQYCAENESTGPRGFDVDRAKAIVAASCRRH